MSQTIQLNVPPRLVAAVSNLQRLCQAFPHTDPTVLIRLAGLAHKAGIPIAEAMELLSAGKPLAFPVPPALIGMMERLPDLAKDCGSLPDDVEAARQFLLASIPRDTLRVPINEKWMGELRKVQEHCARCMIDMEATWKERN